MFSWILWFVSCFGLNFGGRPVQTIFVRLGSSEMKTKQAALVAGILPFVAMVSPNAVNAQTAGNLTSAMDTSAISSERIAGFPMLDSGFLNVTAPTGPNDKKCKKKATKKINRR